MPYTIAHLAVVLPAFSARKITVRSAFPWAVPMLVLGAMAPDFPYFIDPFWLGFSEVANVTHTWWSMLTINFIVCFGIATLWFAVVRDPFFSALSVNVPASQWKLPRGTALLVTYGAAVGGGATHLLWDAFTHRRGAAVAIFPILTERVAGYPLYKLLQHGSSILGLTIVTLFLWKLYRNAQLNGEARTQINSIPASKRGLIYAVLIGAATGAFLGILRLVIVTERISFLGFARTLSTFPITGILLAILCWAFIVRRSHTIHRAVS